MTLGERCSEARREGRSLVPILDRDRIADGSTWVRWDVYPAQTIAEAIAGIAADQPPAEMRRPEQHEMRIVRVQGARFVDLDSWRSV